jgi:magnesium chelatase family protein
VAFWPTCWGRGPADSVARSFRGPTPPRRLDDLADVRGQAAARRAVEIAAAGNHNLLMIGPPGAGKTMLARRLPGVLPALSAEALEVTAIHSVAGFLSSPRDGCPRARPFRAPHHTVSEVGLVGGGDGAASGRGELAHHGVLFLDELAEFRRAALEALRQPLEDGVVTISRAHAKATFPARPARLRDEPVRLRLPRATARTGALLARTRPRLPRADERPAARPHRRARRPAAGRASRRSRRMTAGESSAVVRERVERARAVQSDRKARRETRRRRTRPSPARSRASPRSATAGLAPLGGRVSALSLSARAYGKVLRVARTIADLDGATAIGRRTSPRPSRCACSIAASLARAA